MKNEKFLTVYAVFDEKTQTILKQYQDRVVSLGHSGTQTTDIPFHISLGTYSVDEEENLKRKICEVCKKNESFDIALNKINRFGYKVLFVEPKLNADLSALHTIFDNNFFNNDLPWHPHATIFMGADEQVKDAEQCLTEVFEPFTAKIVGIHLAEFFSTRKILEEQLEK